ncbi:MAG: hypothetical protein WCB91_00255, partial [Halobacteriota archaeon]
FGGSFVRAVGSHLRRASTAFAELIWTVHAKHFEQPSVRHITNKYSFVTFVLLSSKKSAFFVLVAKKMVDDIENSAGLH